MHECHITVCFWHVMDYMCQFTARPWHMGLQKCRLRTFFLHMVVQICHVSTITNAIVVDQVSVWHTNSTRHSPDILLQNMCVCVFIEANHKIHLAGTQ